MKTRISNYTFNAATFKVTFTDYTTISLDAILLITNVTSNIIIYNFADPLLGGTVVENVLTLDHNTSAMSNSDKLMIYYDNQDIQATNATLQILQDQNALLKRMTRLMESNAVVDSGSRQIVVIGAGTVSTSGGTFTGVGAVGSGNSYAVSTNPYVLTTGVGPVINSEFPVDQRWRVADAARATFAMGIRANLK